MTIPLGVVYYANHEAVPKTYERIEATVKRINYNIPESTLKTEKPLFTGKAYPNSKTVVLEKGNTVVIRSPVNSKSMSKAMFELNELSFKLNKEDKIYLVLDTPGGSVFAGLDFIDYAKALPQKIITITKFAASMGFQIVQNLDDRYITPSGTLMSHRASGGVSGQFDGELESRYKMIKENIAFYERVAKEYKNNRRK